MRSLRVAACAATAVLAASLAACGGATDPPAPTGPILSLNTTEPENVLVPGNTTDAGGSKIVRSLFKGLVEYDAKTAAPRNAVAQQIDSTDARVFTITLRRGWTFHDGTAVTARSFADAWNYTAYAPNHQQGAGFLSLIEGFDRVHTIDPDGPGPRQAPEPAARELSGVRVVDDHHLVVTLAQPYPAFPTRLGHIAFSPLPAVFFTDRARFTAHPIGNGPFSFVRHDKGTRIIIERFDGYAGGQRPSITQAEFRFNPSLEGAYADVVAGRLDFLEVLPGDALVGGRYKQELAGRTFSRTGTGLQSISFPLYDSRFADPVVRRALSMAIDRQGVIDKVFTGDRTPADGLVPASVRGSTQGQCGELCTYRPALAKQLLDSTGFQGAIEISSNIESANEKWLTAVCASITAAVQRECRFVPVPTLGEFRRAINGHQMATIYRTGWVADYPSIENFLNPLYRTGGSSNTGLYSNPAVDALLARADAAVSEPDSHALYQEAERLVLQDMPAIPLLIPGVQTGWSPRLRDVVVSPFRDLDLETVKVV